MEVINNTHIELTKIVKFKGEYYNAKCCFYIADIARIEASKRFDNDETCTKIVLADEYYFKVAEKYKKVKDVLLKWVEINQSNEKTNNN